MVRREAGPFRDPGHDEVYSQQFRIRAFFTYSEWGESRSGRVARSVQAPDGFKSAQSSSACRDCLAGTKNHDPIPASAARRRAVLSEELFIQLDESYS